MHWYYYFLYALRIVGVISLSSRPSTIFTRRASISLISSSGIIVTPFFRQAQAKPTDCLKDCIKNCNLIAPKDASYCKETCESYCAQDDRTDGLSGSVSSTGGETGILGIGTVVKGGEKPPDVKLPGLDFLSDSGRNLISPK